MIHLYQQRLGLEKAKLSPIIHEDAIVAEVYKVTHPSGEQQILKICEPSHYLREVYFLNHFANILPVPRIVNLVPPETTNGAILMECLPGAIATTLNNQLAYDAGALLARIHLEKLPTYGDLIYPQHLTTDPSLHFTSKFNEGLAECSNHLPQTLLNHCRHFYDTHPLKTVDGPCIIHRDYRPGNLIIHEGKIQGIIDWSSARAGFAEEDFCSLEHGEWSTDKAIFLKGYASIRPVPDYSELMPLLRLSKAIASIGFTIRRKTWDTTDAKLYKRNLDYLETLTL